MKRSDEPVAFRWAAKAGKILAVVIAIAIILVFVATFAIPPLANTLVEDKITRTLTGAYHFSACDNIQVKSRFIGLLSGNVDNVSLACDDVVIRGMAVDHLEIDLADVFFDVNAAVVDRKARIVGIDQSHARIVIGEAALNKYVTEKYPALKMWRISLPGEVIEATGTAPILGPTSIKYQPLLNGDSLVLHPIKVTYTSKHRAALLAGAALSKDVPVDLPVNNLPFDMKIKGVSVRKGEIEFDAGK